YLSNTTPTLAWSTASNASSYEVEISTDPTFATVQQTQQGLTTPAFVPAALPNGRHYYRARGVNLTGPGPWSEPGLVHVDSWAPVNPLPTRDAMLGITCRNAQECVIVGGDSLGTPVVTFVARTTDGGKSFQRAATPSTTTLNSVAAADADTLVAVGKAGTVLRSTDFGASWRQITTDSAGAALGTGELYKVHFNGAAGVIAGASGFVALSTDKGASWKVVTKPSTSSAIYEALVTDPKPPQKLVAFSNTTAWYSENAGESWTSTALSLGGIPDGDIASDGTIFIGNSNVFRSLDQGKTFSQVIASGGTVFGLFPIDVNNVLIAGGSNATSGLTQVRRANVAGSSPVWTNAVRVDPSSSLLMGLSVSAAVWVDASLNGLAVGYQGSIWSVSANGSALELRTPQGASGTQVNNTTTSGNVQTIRFASANLGFAATTSTNLVFRTTNGGRSWNEYDVDPALTNERFYDLHFFDAQHGIGVGSATHTPVGGSSSLTSAPWAVRTTDGGNTWTTLELPSELRLASKNLNGLRFKDANTGFVTPDAQTTNHQTLVLKWNGTGNRFEAMPVVDSVGLPWNGKNMTDVDLLDATQAIAVGVGTLARLDAANDRWVCEQPTTLSATTTMNSVAIVDPNTVVAVGNSGNIYRRVGSLSAPGTWTKIPHPTNATSALNKVLFDGQRGYIVGAGTVILVSQDGGATWSTRPAPWSTLYGITRVGPDDF
ncbi:MAG: WD40/YVTN/BNR-like repeat-containing protein, partial [Myxococcales bacterium]